MNKNYIYTGVYVYPSVNCGEEIYLHTGIKSNYFLRHPEREGSGTKESHAKFYKKTTFCEHSIKFFILWGRKKYFLYRESKMIVLSYNTVKYSNLNNTFLQKYNYNILIHQVEKVLYITIK